MCDSRQLNRKGSPGAGMAQQRTRARQGKDKQRHGLFRRTRKMRLNCAAYILRQWAGRAGWQYDVFATAVLRGGLGRKRLLRPQPSRRPGPAAQAPRRGGALTSERCPLAAGLVRVPSPREPRATKSRPASARPPGQGAARRQQGRAGQAQRRRAARGAAACRRRRAGKVRARIRAGGGLAPPQQCGRVECRLPGAGERSTRAVLHAH